MRRAVPIAVILSSLAACEPARDPDREPVVTQAPKSQSTPPASEPDEPSEGEPSAPTGPSGPTGPTAPTSASGPTGPTFQFPIAKLSDHAVNIIDSAAAA